MTNVTADECRTAARLLLTDDFTNYAGNYVAESNWFTAKADKLDASQARDAEVEALAKAMVDAGFPQGSGHPAWDSVSDAGYRRWCDHARTAIGFLTSTGRLIPAGGMALTAEQVEDVRTVSNCALQYGNIASREAAARLDSSLAPARLAEEETKAVTFDEIAQSLKRLGDAESSFGFNLRFWRRIAEKLIAKYPHLASSPVVPARTETGPWQTWQEVPDDTPYHGTTENGLLTETIWVNTSGARHPHRPSGYVNEFGDYADFEMHNFAPFVAAEEG
ncbi:hypothetical protein RCF19_30065 [Rhodococcus qingshengii]